MGKIKIGYDVNLEIPNDFAQVIGCEVVPYNSLDELLNAFNKKELAAAFIPAGTLPYVSNPNIVSQALFRPTQKASLQTNFVSLKEITLEEVKNSSIGRVNKGCTTSFWAPLLCLMEVLPKNTLLNFHNTEGFKDLLFKTADGALGSSMVWNIILELNPTATDKVRQFLKKDGLPTPVIIANSLLPQAMINKINQFKSTDQKTFFNGFQKPDLRALEDFQSAINKAIHHFDIKVE